MIETIIFILTLLTLLTAQWFFFRRNDSVFIFKRELNHRCYEVISEYGTLALSRIDTKLSREDFKKELRTVEKEVQVLEEIWDSISKISYSKMLYSFKPLTKENWLSKKQLCLVNGQPEKIIKYI